MGSGGSFVAILLSIPLTAVALVGVVGVPKLQEILSNTTSHGDDEFDEDSFSPRSRSKRGSSRGDRDKEEDASPWGDESDLKEEFSDDLGSRKSPKSKSTLARNGKSKPADDGFIYDLKEDSDDFINKPRKRFGQSPKDTESEMYATEPFKAKSPIVQAEHVTPANTPRASGRAGSDNFASSIEKLRSMGVERFHLEPGLAAGQYRVVIVQRDGQKDLGFPFAGMNAPPYTVAEGEIKEVDL